MIQVQTSCIWEEPWPSDKAQQNRSSSPVESTNEGQKAGALPGRLHSFQEDAPAEAGDVGQRVQEAAGVQEVFCRDRSGDFLLCFRPQ